MLKEVLTSQVKGTCAFHRQVSRLPAVARTRLDRLHDGMPTLVQTMDDAITAFLRSPQQDADVAPVHQAVQAISARIFRGLQDPTEENGIENREGFLACNGHIKIVRLFHLNIPTTDDDSDIVATVNECFHVLTELIMCVGNPLLDSLCSRTQLMSRLFAFMAHKHTLDTALTLAQEILAADRDVFPLQCLPDLPQLVESLPPRRLALFCRILAVVLSKPAESLSGGIPAPECVAPNLCDSCQNNNLLVKLPVLLPRIVQLLRMSRPPRGLWGEPLMALLPPHAEQHYLNNNEEDTWESLAGPLEPPANSEVTVLLLASQVGPQLLELVAPIANQMPQGVGMQMPPNNQVQWLQLSALENTLWATLQGDVLYVVWALMGAKSKKMAQSKLVADGFVDVLHDMFNRLDWHASPPAQPHTAEDSPHGAGCTCHPVTCLQIQMLRTLQVFCEKDNNRFTHHRLLLSPAEQKVLYPGWHPTAPSTHNGPGLLVQLVQLLLSQPRDSIYSFWLAACVHKWVQASTQLEQEFVASIPGWMEFVVEQIIQSEDQCFTIRQVFFDLLGEMIKYNPKMLRLLEGILRSKQLHESFRRMVESHIMDASIFMQCVCLTIEKQLHAGAFLTGRFTLLEDAEPTGADSEGCVAESCASEGCVAEEEFHDAQEFLGEAVPVNAMPEALGDGQLEPLRAHQVLGGGCEELHTRERHTELYNMMTPAELKVLIKQRSIMVAEPCEKADMVQALLDASWVSNGVELSESVDGEVSAIVQHSEVISMKLTCAVQAADINVDTMCVVNAAIVFFMIAARHNKLEEYLIQMLQADGGPGFEKPEPRELAVSFNKLLTSWNELYQGHACERDFLEFSSAIAFSEWDTTVKQLREELETVINKASEAEHAVAAAELEP